MLDEPTRTPSPDGPVNAPGEAPSAGRVALSYDGPTRLLTWRDDAREGMTVDLALGIPGPDGGHPFRTMTTGREVGQRLAVACVRREGEGLVEVYGGEAILMRWSENDRTGMMARLMLDDGPDGASGVHPFKGLATGRKTGEPVDVKAVAIADDETAAPPSSIRRRTPFGELSEVKQTQILCRDRRFVAFLRRDLEVFVPDESSRLSISPMDDAPDGFPAAVLRVALNVASRAVMNLQTPEGERARRRWHRIMERYADSVHDYSAYVR